MNFFEAMRALEKGEKVRVKDWADKDYYLILKEEEFKLGKEKKVKHSLVNGKGMDGKEIEAKENALVCTTLGPQSVYSAFTYRPQTTPPQAVHRFGWDSLDHFLKKEWELFEEAKVKKSKPKVGDSEDV